MAGDFPEPEERAPESVGPARPGAPEVYIPLARPWTAAETPPTPTNPLRLDRLSGWTAALHLLLLLGTFGALIVAVSFIFYGQSDDEPLKPLTLILATMFSGFALSLVAVVLLRVAEQPMAAAGLASRNILLDIVLGIPVAGASYLAYLVCFGLMTLFWPEGSQELAGNVERVRAMIPDLHPGLLLLLMLGVAAYEEFIFRGILVTHLRRITRSWLAGILLAGALFASMHIGGDVGTQAPAVFFPLWAVAIVWSLVFIWRRSLVPVIVGHALFNWVQLMAIRYLEVQGHR